MSTEYWHSPIIMGVESDGASKRGCKFWVSDGLSVLGRRHFAYQHLDGVLIEIYGGWKAQKDARLSTHSSWSESCFQLSTHYAWRWKESQHQSFHEGRSRSLVRIARGPLQCFAARERWYRRERTHGRLSFTSKPTLTRKPTIQLESSRLLWNWLPGRGGREVSHY